LYQDTNCGRKDSSLILSSLSEAVGTHWQVINQEGGTHTMADELVVSQSSAEVALQDGKGNEESVPWYKCDNVLMAQGYTMVS
jgi:hypothetical protein